MKVRLSRKANKVWTEAERRQPFYLLGSQIGICLINNKKITAKVKNCNGKSDGEIMETAGMF